MHLYIYFVVVLFVIYCSILFEIIRTVVELNIISLTNSFCKWDAAYFSSININASSCLFPRIFSQSFCSYLSTAVFLVAEDEISWLVFCLADSGSLLCFYMSILLLYVLLVVWSYHSVLGFEFGFSLGEYDLILFIEEMTNLYLTVVDRDSGIRQSCIILNH